MQTGFQNGYVAAMPETGVIALVTFFKRDF